MFSAFPSLFHIYNQKSVPTIFFFFFSNSIFADNSLVSVVAHPHGVSGDDRGRHPDNSLLTRLAAPFTDPQFSIALLICQ